MKADIFIPTSNRVDSLKQCMDSLQKQTNKNFHILLVGLKPNESIKYLVSQYKSLSINYFIQKRKGIIPAANEALYIARHEVFIRIDDDVIVDKNWFKNILLTYNLDKKIGGVTGPTIMSEKGLQSRDLTAFLETFKKSHNPFLNLFYHLYSDVLYDGRINEVSQFLPSGVFTLGSNYKSALALKRPIDVNNLEACNWSSRTALLKKIGGFDEIYTKGLSDYHEADAALKIKALGYRLVFNPKANLIHNVEVGIVQKARPAAYYRIQNFIIFYFRFYKIRNLKQFSTFFLNLSLQNGYYFYRFLTTGKVNQLGAIFGTIVGLLKALTKLL